MDGEDDFIASVESVLARYLRQIGRPPASAAELSTVAQRLVARVAERGVPPQLRHDERGEPGELATEVAEPLVAQIVAGLPRESDLRPAVTQLVKACFYPPFRRCRESYRETDAAGHCRRQELAKALTRVSGSHCVDCPYWTDLTPEQHDACLTTGWRGERAEFERNRAVFLPDDFRRVRRAARACASDARARRPADGCSE